MGSGMTRPHIVLLLFVLVLTGMLFLRSREQPLRIGPTPTQATEAPPCAPLQNPCELVDCNRIETGRLA